MLGGLIIKFFNSVKGIMITLKTLQRLIIFLNDKKTLVEKESFTISLKCDRYVRERWKVKSYMRIITLLENGLGNFSSFFFYHCRMMCSEMNIKVCGRYVMIDPIEDWNHHVLSVLEMVKLIIQ